MEAAVEGTQVAQEIEDLNAISIWRDVKRILRSEPS